MTTKAPLSRKSWAAGVWPKYSRVCAELLVKGYARSGEPLAMASYLGSAGKAERALLQFAVRYADQTEADFETFRKSADCRVRIEADMQCATLQQLANHNKLLRLTGHCVVQSGI
jgi:hypothetical protein